MIADISRKAPMADMRLYSVDSFYAKPPQRTGVVLGYAPLRERKIREGLGVSPRHSTMSSEW